ncbi:MAG: hypothetical protein EBS23_00805 [Betaproteobacteria bacterium]|nr:hypothetical protein [Betaproteobacteria bacterium]
MTRGIDKRTTAPVQGTESFVLRLDRYGLWHWGEARRCDPARMAGVLETGRRWRSGDDVDVTVRLTPAYLARARAKTAEYPSIEAAIAKLLREDGDAIAARDFAKRLVAEIPCVARDAVSAEALVALWPIEDAGLVVRLVAGARGEVSTTRILRLGVLEPDEVVLAVLLPAALRAEAMARLGARSDDDTVVRVITGIVRTARSEEQALEDRANAERGGRP